MFEMGPATPSHLDQMDQKLLPLDGKAWHLPDGGERVTVFVLDTGLRLTHFEFRESNGIQVSSRVSCGLDTTFDSEGLGRKCVDMDGHGTAVAALIGGRTLGVAKAVRIVSVKLIDVDGWIFPESAMDGLNYVLSQKRANPSTPMVVNLSWGFFDLFSWHGNKIIRKLVEANVTVVAAAGNEDQNACWHSPSQVDSAIAVGYSDPKDDTFSPDSNHGPCVDIIAPGVNLYSACSYKTHSGSSLAAPLVAGTAALYLQQHPTWTPAQVWAAMERDAVRDVIQNIRGAGTPNLLIQTGPITAAKEEKECPCIAEPISADTGNVAARGLWLQLWPLAVYTQWWTLYMRDVPPQPAERGNCQN
jgi:aqualysin 1